MSQSLTHKRQFFRVAIDRNGHVKRGAEILPCQVIDLCEKGFQLRLEGSFAPGEVLHLEFVLCDLDKLACTLEVTYARPPFLGAVITDISSQHQTSLTRFIDELNILNMTGF
jgi:hypothetical protein